VLEGTFIMTAMLNLAHSFLKKGRGLYNISMGASISGETHLVESVLF